MPKFRSQFPDLFKRFVQFRSGARSFFTMPRADWRPRWGRLSKRWWHPLLDPSAPELKASSSKMEPPKQLSAAGPLPLFQKALTFQSANKVRALGLYPYFRTITSAQDTEVIINGKKVLMLG